MHRIFHDININNSKWVLCTFDVKRHVLFTLDLVQCPFAILVDEIARLQVPDLLNKAELSFVEFNELIYSNTEKTKMFFC